MSTSGLKKKAQDFIPYCKDQGLPHLVGAAAGGVSMQYKRTTMPNDGVVTFEGLGMQNMANALYAVIVQNVTDPADVGYVTTLTTAGFTIVGPDTGDAINLIVIGTLKGQLS